MDQEQYKQFLYHYFLNNRNYYQIFTSNDLYNNQQFNQNYYYMNQNLNNIQLYNYLNNVNNQNIPNSFQQINIGNIFHQVNYNIDKHFHNNNQNLFQTSNTVDLNNNLNPFNLSLNNNQLSQNNINNINNVNNINNITLYKTINDIKEDTNQNEKTSIQLKSENNDLLNKKRELKNNENDNLDENINLDEIDEEYDTSEIKKSKNRRRKKKNKKKSSYIKGNNNSEKILIQNEKENNKQIINMNLRNRPSINKNQNIINNNNNSNIINLNDKDSENILYKDLNKHLNDTFFDFVNNKKHTKKYREINYISTKNPEEFMNLNFYNKMKEKFIPRNKNNIKTCDIIPKFHSHSINCDDKVFSSYNYKKYLKVNKDLKIKDVLNNIEKIWPKNLINYFDDRVLYFISLCNYNVDLAIEHIKNRTREFLSYVDEINKQNINIESIIKIINPLSNTRQEKEKNKRKNY